MVDKFPHKGEDFRIISSSSQYDFTVTESILNTFRHILTG